MNIDPTPIDASCSKASTDAVARLDDDELERLAVHLRLQAQRGEREVFGVAHMLEVEQRLRELTRPVVKRPLPRPMAVSASHPRWKFWVQHDERFFVSRGEGLH